jgi:hypothetical protein
MVRVIEVLSLELKGTGGVTMMRRQIDDTGRGNGRDSNSPARYALDVVADTVEVAIASRRVAAALTRARVLLENWRR